MGGGYLRGFLEAIVIIKVLEAGHPDRPRVEQFIHDRFDLEYNANLRHYMPHLVHLETVAGECVAGVGYRDAAKNSLFVEHYFDEPIEAVIGSVLKKKVTRSEIVEVGNLADARPGGARAAVTALTAYLYGAGFRWVVFTGVVMLRNALFRLGLEPFQIGEADPGRLSEQEQQEWGKYYMAGPLVMAGDIHDGYWSLQFTREVLAPLWENALGAGREQRALRIHG